MANKVLWETAATDRGTIATTELNSLGSNSYATGAAYDNSGNLDQWGALEITLASLTPTGSPYVENHLIQSPGGTNYEDAPSATNLAGHNVAALVNFSTGAGAKLQTSMWFKLPPNKFKDVVKNVLGVAMGASGNTIKLWSDNDEVQ